MAEKIVSIRSRGKYFLKFCSYDNLIFFSLETFRLNFQRISLISKSYKIQNVTIQHSLTCKNFELRYLMATSIEKNGSQNTGWL